MWTVLLKQTQGMIRRPAASKHSWLFTRQSRPLLNWGELIRSQGKLSTTGIVLIEHHSRILEVPAFHFPILRQTAWPS